MFTGQKRTRAEEGTQVEEVLGKDKQAGQQFSRGKAEVGMGTQVSTQTHAGLCADIGGHSG